MILSHDRERGRVSLSTKKLEPTPGDMIRNPKLVFEKVTFDGFFWQHKLSTYHCMVFYLNDACVWLLPQLYLIKLVYIYRLLTSCNRQNQPLLYCLLCTCMSFSWQAEEMAQTFRQRIAQAEAMARADMLRFQPEVIFSSYNLLFLICLIKTFEYPFFKNRCIANSNLALSPRVHWPWALKGS